MLIHFVRNGPAYLPELDAYAEFLHTRGHSAQMHDTSASVPSDARAVWWICGRVPRAEAQRLRHAFQVHEYASASVPPLAWFKDQVKRWTQPRPDFQIFQNTGVRERLTMPGLATPGVPCALRDMGVAQHLLDAAQQAWPTPEFDLVYLGEMTRLRPFMPLLHSLHAAGRTLLLVGDVPAALRVLLPPGVHCTGRVAHTEVAHQLRRARVGLNLVSDVAPYNQQTSTKLLEYCAVGLPVVSNDYAWVRGFEAQHGANFLKLQADPSTWTHSFGAALDTHPYRVPDVRALAWPRILADLPVWPLLLGPA